MRKLILIVHISLDGYVAGTNGELDLFPKGDENLGCVNEIAQTADSTLMGRVSFNLLNQYWPSAFKQTNATKNEVEFSNWYNSAQKIMISKSQEHFKIKNHQSIHNNLIDEIKSLKRSTGKDILIFGSPSVCQSIISENIIDSYWVFVNPVIFGKGIPLFKSTNHFLRLQLINSKQFQNGEIALNYTPL